MLSSLFSSIAFLSLSSAALPGPNAFVIGPLICVKKEWAALKDCCIYKINLKNSKSFYTIDQLAAGQGKDKEASKDHIKRCNPQNVDMKFNAGIVAFLPCNPLERKEVGTQYRHFKNITTVCPPGFWSP